MRWKFYAQRNDASFVALTPALIYQPEEPVYFGSVSINVGPYEAGITWDHSDSVWF